MWSLAKVRNGFADLQNERFHTFAVKYDGNIVGELKYAGRPKSAGGAAWRGRIFNSKRHGGGDVVFYDPRKEAVLTWFKNDAIRFVEENLNERQG